MVPAGQAPPEQLGVAVKVCVPPGPTVVDDGPRLTEARVGGELTVRETFALVLAPTLSVTSPLITYVPRALGVQAKE